MKKIISVIFMVAILVNIIVAEPYLESLSNDYGANDNFNEILDKIIINIMPFSGANNVNMRSTNYPQRDNVGTNLEFNRNIAFESIDINNNNSIYRDEHMVALGGLEGVPIGRKVLSEKHYNGLVGKRPYLSVIFGENGESSFSPVEIIVQSSTDFMYVSQERNIYQRPYELYVSRRKATSSYDYMVSGSHLSDSFVKLGGEDNIRNAELILPSDGDGSYANTWFDLILALPYASYNDNGLTYKNREYPLRDSEDYTSSIEIQLKWTQPYEIYENTRGYYWGDADNNVEWEKRTSGEIVKQISISIPFAGYSSPIDPEYKETTASLIAMPMPAASQLSLNDGDTGPGHEEDVAEIQFLMNFKKYTGTPTSPQNVWMFLSASPSPFSRNNNGFVLVHQNAGNILTSYNSASYKAYVIDEATGAKVEFDGKAIATDYDPLNKTGNDINYIATHCNIDGNGGIGDYLPHEYDSNAGSNTYHHYHEYQGTVSVEIEDTALKPDGMLAGQYTSEIYIHVMTSD